MLRLLIAALIASSLPGMASALEGATCGMYYLESNPNVRIEDKGATITVFDGAEKREYEVALVKLWGIITSAAIESREVDAKVHYFAMHNDKLVFDSVAFVPEVCELPD